MLKHTRLIVFLLLPTLFDLSSSLVFLLRLLFVLLFALFITRWRPPLHRKHARPLNDSLLQLSGRLLTDQLVAAPDALAHGTLVVLVDDEKLARARVVESDGAFEPVAPLADRQNLLARVTVLDALDARAAVLLLVVVALTQIRVELDQPARRERVPAVPARASASAGARYTHMRT